MMEAQVTNVFNLRGEALRHKELREQIAAAFDLAADDEALRDTLEGETEFPELCALALREAKAREAQAEGLEALIKSMKSRKERLEHSAKQMRALIAEAMLDAGEKKLSLPDMTVSVRMGKPRLVIDESALPDRYKVPHITFKPNKDAIQEAVDHGDVPDGVQIANAQPVITVRGA